MARVDFFFFFNFSDVDFNVFFLERALLIPLSVQKHYVILSLNPFNFFLECKQLWVHLYLFVGWLSINCKEGSMSILLINVYLCLAHIRQAFK